MTSVGRALAEWAAREPQRPCLEAGGQVLSYGEVEEQAARVAAALESLGVARGDRVCLMLPNGLPFLVAWLGIARLGAVSVPINTAYRGDLLRHLFNNSAASLVVAGEEYLDRIASVREGLSHLERAVVVPAASGSGASATLGLGTLPFEALLAFPPAARKDVGETDPAVIMYTSGTTGPSKGAVLCHRGVLTFAANHVRHCGIRQDDVCYTCLPLFHGIALLLTAVGGLLAGARVVIGGRFSASTFWQEIRRSGATYASITGSIAQILHRQPPGDGDRDHRLRVLYSVPAPAAIYADFARRFATTLVEAYGATDGQIPVYMPLDAPKIGACGKVIAGFDLQIVDDGDEPCKPGQVGEIVYRSRRPYTMMLGYHGDPQATVAALRNFWFHSGDLGYLDDEGYLHFVDRKKDSIRRRGENISSYEVERVVNDHSAVLESAAVAVPADLGEDEVKIVVVLKPGRVLSPEELIGWCEKRLAYFMIPRYVQFADALPKTPNEKVQKYRLREGGLEGAWDREKAGYRLAR
jgi:crotonobetaine/carnitine-CoA ligase